MSFRWLQGTLNHATFPLVDSTDFATPESNLSAATKMRIYGKLLGNSGLFFVNSGTGSLAGHDLEHVGPSALGLYTIALGTNALSDLSAVFYDQYIFIASAAGAATQILLYSGVRASASDILSVARQGSSRALLIQSQVSNIFELVSDVDSALTSRFSDVLSLLTVTGVSLTSDTMSNLRSAITAAGGGTGATASQVWTYTGGTGRTLTASGLSQIGTAVWTDVIGSQVGSLLSNFYSDFQSRVPKLVATMSQLSDLHSDLRSLVTTTGVLLTSDAMSDIGVAVWLNGTGSQVGSLLSNFYSDFQSRVPKLVATSSQLSDVHSDLRSVLTVTGVSLTSDTMSNLRSAITAAGGGAGATASQVWTYATGAGRTLSPTGDSYIASAVWAQKWDVHSAASSFGSAFEVLITKVSNTYSLLDSRVPDITTTGSDLVSAIWAYPTASKVVVLTPAERSNVASAVWGEKWDVHSLASTFGSAFEVLLSNVSNANSILVVGGGGGATASQVWAYATGAGRTLTPSGVSDIASAVWAQLWNVHSSAGSFGSAFERLLSDASNANSVVQGLNTKLTSQFTYSSSKLSDISNIVSQILGDTVGLAGADLSDIASAVWGQKWDVHSPASTFGSAFEVLLSTVSSLQAGGGGATPSQIWTYTGGTGRTLTPSGLSDVASAVWAQLWSAHSGAGSFGSAFERILSDASNANSILVAGGGGGPSASQIASAVWAEKWDLHSAASSFGSAFETILSTVSTLQAGGGGATPSQIWTYTGGQGRTLTPSGLSDVASAVWAQLWNVHSVAGSFGSAFERLLSDASNANSVVQVLNTKLTSQFTYSSSKLSDLSNVVSQILGDTLGLAGADLSDIASAVWGQKWDVHSTASTFGSAFEVLLSTVSSLQAGGGGATPSQIWTYTGGTGRTLTPSGLSQVGAAVWAEHWNTNSAASSFGSAFERLLSDASNANSVVQGLNTKLTSQFAYASNFWSYLSSTESNVYSLLSQVNSVLSDVSSDVGVLRDEGSDTYSMVQAADSRVVARFPAVIPELTSDPGATPTWAHAMALQYMWLRNSSKSTETKRFLRNHAGANVLSATMADDTVSFTQGRLG